MLTLGLVLLLHAGLTDSQKSLDLSRIFPLGLAFTQITLVYTKTNKLKYKQEARFKM
jgi:hypothetical protein